MNKGQIVIIIFFVVLTLVAFFYFLLGDKEKRYQWIETYRVSSNQPYGTLFIKNLLEGYRPGADFFLNDKKSLKNLLGELEDQDSTDYVFIGQNIFLDPDSKAALIEFIDEGGDAFISSLTPPEEIINAVYFKECDFPVALSTYREDTVNLNFIHNSLWQAGGVQYAFRFGNQDRHYFWSYFNENLFCDSTKSVIPLGYLDREDHINFIKIPAGRGNLYLHSNPLVFTNYFLTKSEKLNYASSVFSHLDGKHIIWDEYSKIPFWGDNNTYNSPLYYIMQQPSLKYAWWLLLLTVVLYILFAAKRKQRVIPVLEKKTNTSLEFVKLISRLHYKNGNHLDMAHKKMKYFLYFVRSRFGIQSEKFREEHIRRLAEKSRVKFADVEVIFMQYYLIEERFQTNIDANRLVDLYDSIDNFYRQCKQKKDHTEHGRRNRI